MKIITCTELILQTLYAHIEHVHTCIIHLYTKYRVLCELARLTVSTNNQVVYSEVSLYL